MAGPATLYKTGDHASRPANGSGTVLYTCTTHNKVYRDDGSSWTDFITLATGIASSTFNAQGDLLSASADDTPVIVPVGANGSSLRANSGASSGIEWQKNNLAASAAPTVDDDTTGGYTVGSRWIDTTGANEYVCLDNTDGAAVWTETTAAGSLDPDQHLPRFIQLLPQLLGSESGSSGAWSNVYHTEASPLTSATNGAGGLSSAGNNTDHIEYLVPMAAGTWTIYVWVRRSSNTGIITISLDGGGTPEGTIDTYNASADAFRGSVAGITVASTGLKTLRLATATKNASSSGFFATLRGIALRRTA